MALAPGQGRAQRLPAVEPKGPRGRGQQVGGHRPFDLWYAGPQIAGPQFAGPQFAGPECVSLQCVCAVYWSGFKSAHFQGSRHLSFGPTVQG